MGIPYLRSSTDAVPLFVRQDWLEKLGLPEPKTMQDVLRIAEAFATRDPDGNGKADTIGLLLQSNLWTSQAGRATEFFEGYGAYPNGWIQDSSGQLVYGAIQPGAKTALTTLADLYKNGYIDREFAVETNTSIPEKVLSGKAGMFYGLFYYPLNVKELENLNPGAKLVPYALPSNDGRPAKVMVSNPVVQFFVVNKKFPNPEALVKLINLSYELGYGEKTDQAQYLSLNESPSGYRYYQHNIVQSEYPNKNLNAHYAIRDAFATGDTSKFDAEQKRYYDWIVKYRNNDRSDGYAWAYDVVFGPNKSVYSVMDYYVKNNLILLDAFYGPPTDTQASRGSTLTAMRDEVFTKIIMGSSPISAFDTFVQDWKRLGGDDITKEVNAWYRASK
jgi:putative aldouronate transport system substrate-binding protein